MQIVLTSRNLTNLLLTSVLVMAVQSAEAVDRFVDGNSGSDSGNSCTDAGSPCASVSQAIDVAVGGDTIRIANAVYTESLQVDKALALRGESRAGTIIQAAAARGQASDRTISVDEDVAVELSDLTIRHGNTDLNGGGLRSIGGDLLIERVIFVDNDAEGSGAGLRSGENIVVMNDVLFRDNSGRTGGGAGLGVNFNPTDVTLTNVTFENNTAQVSGGGLSLFNAETQASDVAFIGNVSDDNGGGLSYIGSNSVDSTLALTNAVFIGNEATDFGGGMYTQTDDTPFTIINALFSGNLAEFGGGLYNQAGLDEGNRILINVTMSGNRASRRGGGIDRPVGGMIFRNTIIWNNQDESGIGTAEATMDDFFSSSIIEVSNSLLQGYLAGEFPGSDNLDGSNSGNNPLFRDAVNPGGAPSLAGNLRLQQDSPLRDQGNNSFVAGVDTDLDGEARIFGGTVDLGPYEGTDLIFADGFEDSGF